MTGVLGALLAEPERLLAPLKTPHLEPKRLARAVAHMPERETIEHPAADIAKLQAHLAGLAATDGEPTKRELRLGCQAYLHAPQPPGQQPAVAT